MRAFGFLDRLRLDKTANLFALLTAETILIWLFGLKWNLAFSDYGLGDSGLNLTFQYLWGLGLHPVRDFGYHYGLLSLLIGRVWFGLLGLRPISLTLFVLVAKLVVVCSIARIATRYQVGNAALAFTVAALPYVILTVGRNLAHHVEASLLAAALAEQACERRPTALALATAACFAKPALSYPYGLLLLVFIWIDVVRRDRLNAREFIGQLMPAAVTGVGLLLILSCAFGAGSVISTITPFAGMAAYRAMGFGFFRAGHYFWNPGGTTWRYYAGNPAGVWLIGSAWLVGSAMFSALRLLGLVGRDSAEPCDELILTCAILHLVFVLLMYGDRDSWQYYTFVWLIGIEVTGGRTKPAASYALAVLCFATLLSYRASLPASLSFIWNSTAGPDTGGLWISSKERIEWDQARAIAQGRRSVILNEYGAGGLILPGFQKPVAGELMTGITIRSEVEREVQQLEDASVIVVCLEHGPDYSVLKHFPEIDRALDGTRRVFHGMYLDVYVRDAR
jgi:hypothetical protein